MSEPRVLSESEVDAFASNVCNWDWFDARTALNLVATIRAAWAERDGWHKTADALQAFCNQACAERDSWKMRYESSQDALRELMQEHTELVEAAQRVRRERGSVEYRPDGEPPTVYLATVPHEAMDALDAALPDNDVVKGVKS